MDGGDQYKYWAFISYSHADSRQALALHRWLESYAVPRRLRGRVTPAGEPAPARFSPVFRDRDELASSPELRGVIRTALEASRYVIVVCSPDAARSQWVDDEIAYFQSLGRADRVLALIIDGEPHARDLRLECLPPSLRSGSPTDESGAVTLQRHDPIAADARRNGDGERRARLKLVAGLLGLGLDELLLRERQRDLRRALAWAAGISLVVSLFASVLSMQRSAFEARQRVALLASLVEDGRLELLGGHPMKSAAYLSRAYSMGEDSIGVRFMLHQAMQPIDALDRVIDGKVGALNIDVSPDDRTLWVLAKDWTVRGWSLDTGESGPVLSMPAPAKLLRSCGPYISGDSRRVAVIVDQAGEASKLRIWDGQDGRLLREIDIDPSACRTSRLFSPDGRQVITVGTDHRVMLVGVDDGQIGRPMGDQQSSVAAFDASGRLAATGNSRGEIQLWNTAGWSRVRTLAGLTGAVAAVEFSHDGSTLGAGSVTGAIRAWTLPDGVMTMAGGHTREVQAFGLSDDGRRLLSQSDEGTRVWRAADGALLYAEKMVESQYKAVAMRLNDGRQLVRPQAAGRISIVDVDSGHDLFWLDVNSLGAVFTHDGRRLASVSDNGRIAIWKLGFRPLAQAFHDDRDAWRPSWWPPKTVVAVVPEAGQVVSGGPDGSVRLWSEKDLAPQGELARFDAAVTGVVASADGRWIAAASASGAITIRDRLQQVPARSLDWPGHFISNLRISNDGRYLFAADRANQGRLWRLEDARLLRELALDSRFAVGFSPDSQHLVLGADRKLVVLDPGSLQTQLAEPLNPAAPPIGCAVFSPDSKRVFAMAKNNSGMALVRTLADGRGQLRTIPDLDSCSYAEWSPDGRRVLIVGLATSAAVWDPDLGSVMKIGPHASDLHDADWSPDGRLIVTGGLDSMVKIWDAASGALLHDLGFHLGPLRNVRFSSDGGTVFTTGIDNRVQAWDVRMETRPAMVVESLLRCRSPWRWTDGGLQLDEGMPVGCGKRAP